MLLGIMIGCINHSWALALTQPSMDEVAEVLSIMPVNRPRLFGGQAGIKRLWDNSKLPDGKALANRIIYDATLILGYAPCKRELEGRRMLAVSRKVLYRINTLAVANLLTNDKRFANRAIAEMLTASNFTDWNPTHFLDVAEMTLALSIGYDLLYTQMTPQERQIIAQAIIEKGLKSSLTPGLWWISATNNWSQVCHAGMIAGGIAVYENEPELAAKMIHRAVLNLPKAMNKSYYPNGAYPEGPTYWSYGTEFNSLLLAMLDSALKTDFGLSAITGFDKTLEFIAATTNTTTGIPFTYADCTPSGGKIDFAQIWLMDKFQRIDCFTSFSRKSFDEITSSRPDSVDKSLNRMFPLSMFFLQNYPNEGSKVIPLSYYSGDESLIPISVHRSDPSNQAVYLAIKAGKPAGSHGHMDGGSFVLEADGVRWITDLGIEDYNKLESAGLKIWNSAQESDRWKLFRIGPYSHNILLINNKPQQVTGDARIIEFNGDSEEQYTEVDLLPLYSEQLTKASRRGVLQEDRIVIITDSLSGLKKNDIVRWQICIPSLSASANNNTLTLRKNGKSMTAVITKPENVQWLLTPAEAFMGQNDSANPGVIMASFEIVVPTNDLDIEVQFIPGSTNKVNYLD